MKKVFFFLFLITIGYSGFASTIDNPSKNGKKATSSTQKTVIKKNKLTKGVPTVVTWTYYCPSTGQTYTQEGYFYREQYATQQDYQAAIDNFVNNLNALGDFLDQSC